MLTTSCFQLDNYDAPNAGINGTLRDKETGDIVYTEQPDGCRIELLDLSYDNPTPLYFWAKANGTFRNVALFGGDYMARPIEGPFFSVEAERITLKDITNHNFNVVPYLKVNIQEIVYGAPGSASVKVKYTIRRSGTPEGQQLEKKTIAEAILLCNTVPLVSRYNGGYKDENTESKVLSRSTDESIEAKVYEDEIKALQSGQKYYIRIAALSSCSSNKNLKRYNYTSIVEVIAP